MRNGIVMLGATAALLAAGTARAQAPFQGDRQFLDEATSAGQAEAIAGQLAEKQGTPGTREFGRWMVTDHTLINNLLNDRAKEMGVALPGQGAPSKGAGPDLSTLKDQAFDKPYLAQQIADHQKAIALFENESASGNDAALKRIAQEALPALRDHLAAAQELSAAAGP